MNTGALAGLWLDADGVLHRAHRTAAQEAPVISSERFRPFFWASEEVDVDGTGHKLSGPGPLNRRIELEDPASLREVMRGAGRYAEVVRPYEQQWLMATQERLFGGLRFGEIRRCQVSLETAFEDRGNPAEPAPDNRIVAIGLQLSTEEQPRFLRLSETTDAAERQLLKAFNAVLAELDPDIIEGHDIFNADLRHLRARCRRYRVPCAWGRFGGEARFRSGRLRVAERSVEYLRCDVPGRTIFDTSLALQLFDVTSRDLPNYDLADAAKYFGMPGHDRLACDPEGRLSEEMRQIRWLADRLLPTYVAQVQNSPLLLQEACLRGTGQKVEILLLERYFHAGEALPEPAEVTSYAGGFTKSFGAGVFHRVLHFDVASLYPSLLLQIGRNPAQDSLGALIPLLRDLRAYRLDYKQRARGATDPAERAEFDARQASFKILVNSFYGYLGFPGARFADSDLASEVTARGRDLLQSLIAWFESRGLRVLEADTDGLYVEAGEHYEQAEALLEAAQAELPPGIDLEFDGRYPAMFCYKAKNYALFDGEKIQVRGSALRSRGIEPFLIDLTDRLIAWVLGVEEESPEILVGRFAARIAEGSMPVERLAKSEYLSMNPAAYAAKMEAGGKPRRAALEVALKLDPQPRMGEKVTYFLAPREKGMTADWQRAVPLPQYEEVFRGYDTRAYLKKLRDWEKRYGPFYKPE